MKMKSYSTKHMKVFVILPAYNEAAALPPLLHSLAQTMDLWNLEYHILVVDDGSTDQTREVALAAAVSLPITVLVHERNCGLAAALRTGLQAAVKQANPDDVIITMDADNTHPPGLILRMIQMILEGHDVVIASRYRAGAQIRGVPTMRRAMSKLAAILCRLMFPLRGVSDYTCGYRAYRARLLQAAMAQYGDLLIQETGFTCMIELLLRLRKFRPVVGEVPLVLRYDHKPGKSKMDVRRTALRTLRVLWRFRFKGG